MEYMEGFPVEFDCDILLHKFCGELFQILGTSHLLFAVGGGWY